MFTPRPHLTELVLDSIGKMPVTVLLGARQVGKTTLARSLSPHFPKIHSFDLETTAGYAALSQTPELVLQGLEGLVIIDEVQRLPDLFTILRPLCDAPSRKCQFLLLGSASPHIIRGISESLAGRARYIEIPGLSLEETGDLQKRWLRGGFPRAFHAEDDRTCFRWLEDFTRSYLERDLPQFGISRIPAQQLQRLWSMMAHYHGQLYNASEIAKSIDLDTRTLNRIRDIMEGSYMVHTLAPWFENMGKRLVKSSKLYIKDSGILHHLLGIQTTTQLYSHPKLSASWEGFALMEILNKYGSRDAYFWATQSGAELDLLISRNGKHIGFGFKCSDAPSMTKSMHIAIEDLKLEQLYVVYPGSQRYLLHKKVEAIPLQELLALSF